MCPKVFEGVVRRYLKLESQLVRAWWAALSRSKWSRARELRQLLWSFNSQRAMPEDVEHFWHAHLSPHQLVAITEELVQERRLSRRHATSIEEAVLAMLTPEGRWK